MEFDKNLQYASEIQTLIGTQKKRLQDLDTGELIEVDQITKRIYGKKQFWKVYLMDFLQILGILESKQLDVLIYILENTEQANNTFIGSQRDIANNTKISLYTVSKTIIKLQNAKFISKIKNNVYQINPQIMMKGSEYKKSLILNYYNEEDNRTKLEKQKEQ